MTDPEQQRADLLIHQIAEELSALGPPGWTGMMAEFGLRTEDEDFRVKFFDDRQEIEQQVDELLKVGITPSEHLLAMVHEHRGLSAQLGNGRPWRSIGLDRSGWKLELGYDSGYVPVPPSKSRKPVPRQSRTAQQAAAQARADRAAGVRDVATTNEYPHFPQMWARWAVIAAATVGAGLPYGSRILPSVASWENGSYDRGSMLAVLPGGRAVLSGGERGRPGQIAKGDESVARSGLFAGAPEWVTDPVLNHRASWGDLAFCYWWENGTWRRGESPTAEQVSNLVPGVWTRDTVAKVALTLRARDFHERPTAHERELMSRLVSAAETGSVTREALVELFDGRVSVHGRYAGDGGNFDIDGAFHQLTLAGVATELPRPLPAPMPADEAIGRVRRYVLDMRMNTTGYPLEELVADRFSVGWMVYVPVPRGEIAIGRAIFYIGDDDVLEHSSSSTAPKTYIAGFEQRFRQRHGLPADD